MKLTFQAINKLIYLCWRVLTCISICISIFISNVVWAETAECKHDVCTNEITPNWEINLGSPVSAAPTLHKNIIYIGAGNTLFALNSEGKKIWSYDAQSYIGAKVSIVEQDKTMILLHADNGLHAINLSGKKHWFYPAKDHNPIVVGKSWGWGEGKFEDPWGWYRSVPLIIKNTVYFGAGDGVYAVNLQNGKKVWHTKTGTIGTTSAQYKKNIIVGSWDNYLYSLNINDGKINWKFKGAETAWIGNTGFNLSPTISDDIVYAGSRNTYFYAIDANTGDELWHAKDPSSWIGSQALIHEESVFYGLSDGNAVEQHDKKTGKLLAKYDTKLYVYVQPSHIVKNNKNYLIVANMAGELLAVDLTSKKVNRIFQTPQSKKNFRDGITIFTFDSNKPRVESEKMFIDAKFKKLGAFLNMTVLENMIYVGSGNGVLYALEF